jgi:Amt family ammonium transporter
MAVIAVTTNLAAASGTIGSLLAGWFFLKKPDVGITLNGALAGLVGITAGCANVSPAGAIFIGFSAGILVVFSVLFFDKLKIDDPVGAISVHGTCGAWGTLIVGLIASEKYGGVSGSFSQFLIQLTGVASAFVWALGTGLLLFFILKKTIGIRVGAEEEADGLDTNEHGADAYADFRITYR